MGRGVSVDECRLIVRFVTGGRVWCIDGVCSLLDMELLQGRRLPLGEAISLEVEGYTLYLHEWGLLLQFYLPGTRDLSESQYSLWAFPEWLNHMEQQGTPRAKIVGDAGLQALEWHAQYIEWAKRQELQHARWELEHNRLTPDELYVWCPRLRHDPEWLAYLESLDRPAIHSTKGRGGGRPRKPVELHVRELYLLALDLYRIKVEGLSDDWLSACWHACRLRPDWVPNAWRADEGKFRDGQRKGPGQRLYDLARKPHIAGSILEDRLHIPAPEGWAEQRQPGWRGRKGKAR